MSSAFEQFGAAIADYVFHPDYYKGRWYVQFRGRRRVCKNHVTSVAWQKYLRRHFDDGWLAVVGRADPLPGFPREIS